MCLPTLTHLSHVDFVDEQSNIFIVAMIWEYTVCLLLQPIKMDISEGFPGPHNLNCKMSSLHWHEVFKTAWRLEINVIISQIPS